MSNLDFSPKWSEYFMNMAREAAKMSKDPRHKVGAVIVRPDRTVAGMGYNGFPRGVKDDPERYKDKPTKRLITVHAEANAILNARENLTGTTLFVSPLHPCSNCSGLIIQSGIKRIIYEMPKKPSGYWDADFGVSMTMMSEAGIKESPL